jgi:hypothetical protein
MTTNINVSAAGLTQTVDASGNLQIQTANVAAITIDLNQNVRFNGTGALTLPSGDSTQRPATAANGAIRYNTSLSSIEGLISGSWAPIKTFSSITVDYLIVAGGGGGGSQVGGGGGGGGIIQGSGITLTPGTNYSVTVGAGGAGTTSTSNPGSQGSGSAFSTFATATGGGGGGSHQNNGTATSGGSGGGGGGGVSGGNAAGAGTMGQGFAGGAGQASANWSGGGGGGAGGIGNVANVTGTGVGGRGGAGLAVSITGNLTYYAGGGGGCSDGSVTTLAAGGLGGGGSGWSTTTYNTDKNGQANTGGGGGGVRDYVSSNGPGGAGGSGVVIIRYASGIPLATGGNTITSYSSSGTTYQVHQFNSSGTLTTINNPTYQVNVNMWGGGGAGGNPGGWVYGAPGGAGGAASAVWNISPGTAYNIVVGGPGIVSSFNTGAAGGGAPASLNGSDNRYGSGSGGYSGIFLSSGISQATALLIAGGGGGGGSSRAGTGNSGGAGGGTTGETGYSPYDGKIAYAGKGGTQSAAGTTASSDSVNNTVQQGALQGGTSPINSYGGAGGGGYWGGSGGGYSESNTMAGGGGGSGYIAPNTFVAATLYQGLATTPGNSTHALRGTYGNAGAVSSNGTGGAVIIWYAGAQKGSGGTVTSSGGYTYHTFTTAGNFIA